MCRTCKAENPKWSKGVRVPVKDLPLFFASQPSWNFEQKIYGHNVVITERARPTLTGRLGCHDIEGVVHRRQDHFLVREIFHCPGKKYNCSPRLACTGRRRHCYGLCKVTVYSANKDVAIVQFAGTHGTGVLQRRVWPYNQYESAPESPPRDMSKKESKMRAIFGSPSKADDLNWQQRSHRSKIQEDLSAFKQPLKHVGTYLKDENMDMNELNNYYQPRLYTHPQMNISCPTSMIYPSPPGFEGQDPLLSPDMSPEERLKHQHQQQQMMTCSQLSPYSFYPQHMQIPNTAQSPQNFWNTPGLLMNQHLPITPPQVKSELLEEQDRNLGFSLAQTSKKSNSSPYLQNDYIPTLSEVNCRVEDMEPSYVPYDMSSPHTEPFQKRRKMEMPPSSVPMPGNLPNMGTADIWRPYLHPGEFGEILPQVKLEPNLFSTAPNNSRGLFSPDVQAAHQDNFIHFMVKGDEQNNHFVRDSQKILANMSGGLQLTKL